MGKHLDLANRYAQWLKPRLEERTGVKLEDITVRDSSEYRPPPELESPIDPRTMMFVCQYDPKTIFMIENLFIDKPLSAVYLDTAHEMGHLTQKRINADEASRLFPPSPEDYRLTEEDARLLCQLTRRYVRCYERESFNEGFAEYLSLDYLRDMYSRNTKLAAQFRAVDLLDSRKYQDAYLMACKRGYRFFKDVLGAVGSDKLIEVARSPPETEAEVRAPSAYLMRNYNYKKPARRTKR